MDKEKKIEYLIISILPLSLLIFSIVTSRPDELISGMKNILLSNGILLTDYFAIGGRNAAIFNVSLITLANIALVYFMQMKINGLVISGLYLMLGFSFLGKNLLNIIPFYIGAYFFSKISGRSFKTVVITTMFSTSLAPIVSTTARFFNFNEAGILMGLLVGIFLGFIVPPVAAHVLQIHSGYSLYNTGFAAGLVAIAFYSILKAADITVKRNDYFFNGIDYDLVLLLCAVFLFFIIYGFIKNKKSFKGFFKLLKHTGRLVSDFTVTDGFPLVLINMGTLGFLCLVFVFIFLHTLNGPVLGGLFTVIAFAGMGKHIKNILPVMFGVVLAFYIFSLNGTQISATSFGIILFFSTTLAPIAGKFGIFAGLTVGFLNYCLVLNIGAAHGGLNLYNNGLSAGIVAAISVPLLNFLQELYLDMKDN